MGSYAASASGGTGNKLTTAVVILAGVASLIATLISIVFVHSLRLKIHVTAAEPHMQIHMVSDQELPKAPPPTICHTNPSHGPNLLSFLLGKHHVN
jgi:hypothetical protein